MDETSIQWVKAGTVENRFEGDRVSQALEEAGIPFLIKSFHDTAYDGLFILQKGWGVVLVPETFCGTVEKMMAELKAEFEKEEGDEIGQPG
jgi:hypothetical protein